MENPLLVLAQVASILDQQDINYILVGSLASSMHGMYRATADIDILADIKPKHVQRLVQVLSDDFYLDERAVRDAIHRRSSFNAIHFGSVFKVDFFIPKGDAFAAIQLQRKQLRSFSSEVDQKIYVASPEDTILAKLRWYREGHEVSTTQWSDVIGMIGAANDTLDISYLRQWAEKLGVTDLLERAISEAA
ncbi:MAG TPA: hypothetical protein VJU86_03065 [Pyrinomonadaceae bacterium]|nr:hypothetical protein [Pyrinomonadaceae bacterium]